MLIRDAIAQDWASIWPFLSGIVTAGETYSYDRDLTEDDARGLWMMQPPGRTVVALDPDAVDAAATVLGTAKIHRNHGGPAASEAAPSSVRQHQPRAAAGLGTLSGYRATQFNAMVETNTAHHRRRAS